MAKHEFASISITVRDRAISSKFSTHRVSKECTLQFSKNFPLPKNGSHFEFSNFCQKWQNTPHFRLLYRSILTVSSHRCFPSRDFQTFHRVSKECSRQRKQIWRFPFSGKCMKTKIFLNFRILFAKNGKTT